MCARTGCSDPGDRAPRLVFVLEESSGRRWKVPAIMGILFCARCATGVKADNLLADDRIVQSLLALNDGARHVETRVEWVAPTDPDYRRLQAMRVN